MGLLVTFSYLQREFSLYIPLILTLISGLSLSLLHSAGCCCSYSCRKPSGIDLPSRDHEHPADQVCFVASLLLCGPVIRNLKMRRTQRNLSLLQHLPCGLTTTDRTMQTWQSMPLLQNPDMSLLKIFPYRTNTVDQTMQTRRNMPLHPNHRKMCILLQRALSHRELTHRTHQAQQTR